jgi:hypothetical protein
VFYELPLLFLSCASCVYPAELLAVVLERALSTTVNHSTPTVFHDVAFALERRSRAQHLQRLTATIEL